MRNSIKRAVVPALGGAAILFAAHKMIEQVGVFLNYYHLYEIGVIRKSLSYMAGPDYTKNAVEKCFVDLKSAGNFTSRKEERVRKCRVCATIAEEGIELRLPEAQSRLGILLYVGCPGVPCDPVKGERLLAASAESKDSLGMAVFSRLEHNLLPQCRFDS
jgi:hypothetical protein